MKRACLIVVQWNHLIEKKQSRNSFAAVMRGQSGK